MLRMFPGFGSLRSILVSVLEVRPLSLCKTATFCQEPTKAHLVKPMSMARIQGDQIEFWFELQGTKAAYTGTVNGDSMTGTCDYGGLGSGEWHAEKSEAG